MQQSGANGYREILSIVKKYGFDLASRVVDSTSLPNPRMKIVLSIRPRYRFHDLRR